MLLLPDFYAFYSSCARTSCVGGYLIDSDFVASVLARSGVDSRLGFRCCDLLTGGCPAATHFLLLRQKKVSKEKATRLSGSLRFASGNLRCPKKTGVGANSLHCVALKQRAALIPFFWGITGPDRTGLAGNEIRTAEHPDSHRDQVSTLSATNSIASCACSACGNGTFYAQTRVFASVSGSVSAPSSPVLAGPVLSGKSGIRAARCLSRRRVCADPRFCRSAQVARSEAQGPGQPGRLSFAYFSLAKQRKVSYRRATPGQQTQAKPATAKVRIKTNTEARP